MLPLSMCPAFSQCQTTALAFVFGKPLRHGKHGVKAGEPFCVMLPLPKHTEMCGFCFIFQILLQKNNYLLGQTHFRHADFHLNYW